MTKRLLALFTALTLLLSMAVPAYAVDGPCITAQAATTPQGSTVSIEITAQQFSAVGSVDFTVYYDADALTVTDTSNGWMIDGYSSFLSVNTDIAGQINVSAVTMDGFYDSGTLLYLYFEVAMDCPVKSYPLAVTVGNAYGNDLMPMRVSAVDGKIAVTERSQEKRQFHLYGWPDKTNVQQGDTFTLPLQNNYYYSGYHMASGDFTVKYDPDLFQVDSVALSDAMKAGDAIWSVNTDIAGTVLISYAASNNVASYELLNIQFSVIGNTDTSSTITYSCSNVYDEELLDYLPSSNSFPMYLSKAEEVIDYPDLWLETPRLVVGQQVTSTLMLQKGAAVAAGDFVVTYDPTALRCVSVTAATGLSAAGGMVVVDDHFTDGTIEFPYINSDGYDEEDIPLIQIVWEPLRSSVIHSVITPSGSMIYDAQFQPVILEYVPETDCVFVRTVIAPTCLEDGRTNYTCACGESFDEDPVPQLGHDIRQNDAKNPTCTEVGWYAYEGCARCKESSNYREIPALGHDEIPHAAQTVSCTEIGWDAYVTCSRCDYSTYEEIPALGHRTIASRPVLTDPLSLELAGDIPFTLENGVYYSNNHTDSSSSEIRITALYDCSLRLICGVSSEQNYDELIIWHNSQHVAAFSGSLTGQEVNLPLSAGDTVTVLYNKDGSVFNGQDRGWVELQYEFVMAEGLGDFPSEELTPDCANSVVCSYCNAVVKKTLPHDYNASFQWNGDHSVCKATLACKDCSAQEEVDCTVTEDISDPQKTVHTAVAVQDGQKFTDTLRCDNYAVQFLNWDGSELSKNYYHLGKTVTPPADPTKAADETYTYEFLGWDQEVVPCQGETVYTATFFPTYIDYTVVFQNWDGSAMMRGLFHYGDTITPPQDPTRPADKTYSYTFAGWDKELICTGDMTVTATYTPVFIDYTVVFQNWDGAELSRQTYHYGDAITPPETPAKPADKTYTYTFAGWDKELICNGDMTVTATYTPVFIDYTVVFQNWDGAELSRQTYHYGDAITPPETPAKPADETYSYTFAGWDKELVCNGEMTFTATYTPVFIDYTVVFQNWDGAELSRQTCHYGDAITPPETPTKTADETYTYTFAGWDKALICNGEMTVTATYTPVFIDYTVTFLNSDGSILSQRTYHYGDTVEVPAEPQKPADVPADHVFKGWDSEVIPCAGNTTYTAVYGLPYPRGDMNCDFQVTDADALYLLRHTLFPQRYPLQQSGDVNGDGEVTDADALYLLRFTLFPQRYPLH